METQLSSRKVPINRTHVDESKVVTGAVRRALMSACAADPQVKYLAQKAFVAYVRSVYLHRNKEVFDVSSLPLAAYAESLGLPGTPKIKFVQVSEKMN